MVQLDMSEEERQALIGARIPFELYMQTLREHADISDILAIFEGGSRNTNHLFLASQVKAGHLHDLCTTNFDLLFEAAFGKLDLKADIDYAVFANDDRFSQIQWSNPIAKLTKIHGTVQDKSEMAVTLRQVAAKFLADARKAVIDRIFVEGSHEAVLVLGYSCSDLFDISPQIETCGKSEKQVFLVEHLEKGAREEPISLKRDQNPFHEYRGRRLFVNTDALIRELWKTNLDEPYQRLAFRSDDSWKGKISSWIQRNVLVTGQRDDVVASFMYAAGCPRLGLKRTRSPIPHKHSPSIELAARLLNNGAALGQSGHYGEAVQVLNEALSISRDIASDLLKAKILSNMAGAYRGQGRISHALQIANEALACSMRAADTTHAAMCNVTIGLCYHDLGNQQTASDFLEKAYNAFLELGELNYASVALGNLALCKESQNDRRAALDLHKRAYSLARSIGHSATGAVQLGNIVRLASNWAIPRL